MSFLFHFKSRSSVETMTMYSKELRFSRTSDLEPTALLKMGYTITFLRKLLQIYFLQPFYPALIHNPLSRKFFSIIGGHKHVKYILKWVPDEYLKTYLNTLKVH